jgi:hypothetical protein
MNHFNGFQIEYGKRTTGGKPFKWFSHLSLAMKPQPKGWGE